MPTHKKDKPAPKNADKALTKLLREIHACRLCAPYLTHEPRPVLRLSATARICIAGQAPGIRVHKSGVPFNDPSGDRLRDWLGIDREIFYDESKIAIVPMGFCFPGYTAQGADKPPRPECARTWHDRVFAEAPRFSLLLAIGGYAQRYHLKEQARGHSVDELVRSWRDFTPGLIPLPHPSWRNNAWLKRNPWFEEDLLPYLRHRVRSILRAC